MAIAETSSITVRKTGGSLGAEVTGVDLNDIDDADFAAIKTALDENLVIFFPGQQLTLEGHRGFAGRFGELECHPYIPKVDETIPEVVRIDDKSRADTWHTDVTFSKHPPIASVFHYISGPDAGGDTMWTNMYMAYDELSQPMKDMLEGLTATHAAHLFGEPDDTAVHPVVRVHPDTGRKCLYVNRTWTHYINELTRYESSALLQFLYAHSEQPHMTARRSWNPGDVCVWDNRCTMHIAVDDWGDAPRVVHRVTVLGDHPQPAGDLRYEPYEDARASARTMIPLLKGV